MYTVTVSYERNGTFHKFETKNLSLYTAKQLARLEIKARNLHEIENKVTWSITQGKKEA